MSPKQLILILLARWKIALLVMLAVIAAAQAASFSMPKQYTATTSLVVDVRSPDPVAAMLVPLNVSTQMEIINSVRVAQMVVRALRLEEHPALKAQWIESTEGKGNLGIWVANLLKRGLAVQPSRDSTIISISYTAADPVFAATVANAFAQAYIDATIELRVEPARQYARWFGEQGKSLRENLEKAQAKAAAFQQEKGIPPGDEQLANETAKLRELTQRLLAVQAQVTQFQSMQRSGKAADTLQEVMQNPLITGLKTEIIRQEAKLAEIGLNLGKNHPQYQRMESEIAALKRQVDVETRNITRSFATSRTVGRDTSAEIEAAIEAQKKKLLDLKSVRDELAVLQRDVDAAQNVYDNVVRRFNQTTLESQATQTNVSVLTPAAEPFEPLTSKLFRNPWIAVVLGALLGLGVAIGLEMLDRRVRSVQDLAEMLQLPVLGVIGYGRKRGMLTFDRGITPLLLK